VRGVVTTAKGGFELDSMRVCSFILLCDLNTLKDQRESLTYIIRNN
jgi:hypothetical protein